jgi:uncharacterized protein
LEKEKLFQGGNMMTDKVLERMISSFLAIDMPGHSFAWQGGEPTMMGLDFYKRVVDYQKRYGRNGISVSNGLQTNGTRLNDEWCRHLTKYNFLVGLSIDGPAEIHDHHRWTVNGSGSHAMVMKGLEALKRNNTEFNVLTLVSDSNVKKPLVVYNYLKDLGVKYHQYIECVEFMSDGKLAPFAVRPEQWGEFLCTIFDEWYSKDRFDVSVRFFDSILSKMVDNIPNACVFANDCRQYLVVEHNGTIYPCDFFVLPEWELGNIMEDEWETLLTHPLYEKFGKRKQQWNDKCETCPYLNMCVGCCPKNRLNHGRNPRDLSALCKGWEIFYEHTLPRFKSIASHIRKERQIALMQEEMERNRLRLLQANLQQTKKVGRNDPCPCGSGKKYKKCCG